MKSLSHKNTIHLTSEALKAVNYSKEKQILEATFNNDRTYQYLRVPKKIWKDFLTIIKSGESAGTYINQKIKPFFDCVEITD